ncbi:MAG: hypothetical protein KBG28_20330 [Kofleriaceae bacterium]|nr:hypothetical protein [Kofleriaceae bacterium]
MKKLNRWAMLTGALAGLAIPSVAGAQEIGRAISVKIHAPSDNDLTDVRIGDDGIARLRKNDEEHTNEQASIAFTPDGTKAMYVEMRTSNINGNSAPNNQIQCAVTPLETFQQADGSVSVRRPAGAVDVWASDNDGNEYRNCHKPAILSINEGKNFLLFLNYQPNNDTIRYAKVLDLNGAPVTIRNANGQVQDQVAIMAKNNDDCSMHQTGADANEVYYKAKTGNSYVTRFVQWHGCNGNGNDDGWAGGTDVACDLDAVTGAATSCTITRRFDLSLAQQEERSRGRCSISDADPNTAFCTWTEGNTQPQREGVWGAAIDLSEGAELGQNADSRLLWKERIAYRQEVQLGDETRRAYAMRAMHARVKGIAADGSVTNSDQVMLRYNGNVGNNTNNAKGGRNITNDVTVIRPLRDSLTYVMPPTDITDMILGTDGTHLSMMETVFGKGQNLMPGFVLMSGSHVGGANRSATLRTIGFDTATGTLKNLGEHSAGAGYDRHLYSNYLGNNPGNQGRNFAAGTLVRNPFEGMNGNKVKYFVAMGLTAKDPTDNNAALKTSSYVSIFPVAFSEDAPTPGGGWQDVPGDTGGQTGDDDNGGDNTGGGGEAVGGCSTGGAQGAGLAGLLLGLAAFIRRRK